MIIPRRRVIINDNNNLIDSSDSSDNSDITINYSISVDEETKEETSVRIAENV